MGEAIAGGVAGTICGLSHRTACQCIARCLRQLLLLLLLHEEEVAFVS